MSISIAKDDLSDRGISDLLAEHLIDMGKFSPAESVHALDVSELHDPAITFWSAREDRRVVACGALKKFSSNSGEVKSMKTRTEYLQQGLASKILQEIITEARKQKLSFLYLETGSHESFKPATALYLSLIHISEPTRPY